MDAVAIARIFPVEVLLEHRIKHFIPALKLMKTQNDCHLTATPSNLKEEEEKKQSVRVPPLYTP